MRKTKPKAVKRSLLDLQIGESVSFPRNRTSSVRTTLSNLKAEYPHREYDYDLLVDEIKVFLLNEKRDSNPSK